MSKQFLPRNEPLKGIERTARDSQVPYNRPRSIKNFSLPDQRLSKRRGFVQHFNSATDGGDVLTKHTGTVSSRRGNADVDTKGEVFKSPQSYGIIQHADDFQPTTARGWTVEFLLRKGDKEELVTTPYSRRVRDVGAVYNNPTIAIGNPPTITTAAHGLPPGTLTTANFIGCSATGPGGSINGDQQITAITATTFQVNGFNCTTGSADGDVNVSKYDFEIRRPGVYVYDQTVLANYLTLDPSAGSVAAGTLKYASPFLTLTDTSVDYDSFALSALAIGFNETEIFATCSCIDVPTGTYIPREIELVHTTAAYAEGDWVHVTLSHEFNGGANSTGRLRLFIDGVESTFYDFPAGGNLDYAGQSDAINGLTTAVKRDIVILNECTVRGSYSSTCKTRKAMHGHNTFFQAEDATGVPDDAPSAPWCLSPPRGTSMTNLRIWYDERTAAEILANAYLTNVVSGAGLRGFWRMESGSTFIPDDAAYNRPCTVHHGYSPYVESTDLLHNTGIHFAEGQHLIFAPPHTVINEASRNLIKTFAHTADGDTDASLKWQPIHNFTVQMQLRTPNAWQQELNDSAGAQSTPTMLDYSGVELRRALGADMAAYTLDDGAISVSGANIGGNIITHPVGGAQQFNRAYDSTLFSIESTKVRDGNQIHSATSNASDRYVVPLVRALVAPDGRVYFECTQRHAGDAPKLYRIRSTTVLAANTTYTVTVVRRVLHGTDDTTHNVTTRGFRLEIWINVFNTTPSTTPDTVVDITDTASNTSGPVRSGDIRVVIAASYVGSGIDSAINAPVNALAYASGGGPFYVPQHFMSPYQDQPGRFTLGFFRLWMKALSPGELNEYVDASITTKDYDASLLLNYEIESFAGPQVVSRCRYPHIGQLSYKSWGISQGYRDQLVDDHLTTELYPGAWQNEDCLGYSELDVECARDYQEKTIVLTPFQSTLTQAYGLLTGFGNHLVYDQNLDGDKTQLKLTGHGMLAEFWPDGIWRGTSIGDRTVLTSSGQLPKVFNGKTTSVAGFKQWTGGFPQILAPARGALTGAMDPYKWYGVCIIYLSSEYGLIHISPRATFKTGTIAAGQITNFEVVGIPAHPDPRVTSIMIARTQAQESQDLAKFSPLYPTISGVIPNCYTSHFREEANDIELINAPIDERVTTMPVCEFSAAMNGRLYMAGDILVPDAVFFSAPGNPELFDTVRNRLILEEGSGDKITGMVSAFGSLWVFKANSIWRVDEVSAGQHQVNRIADIGAVSPDSIITVTMPDTGRSVLIFWSQHGPYMFTGSALQYFGQPIEEPDNVGVAQPEFAWLNSASVVAVHDVRNREILFLHTLKYTDFNGDIQSADRNSEAIVFNYRYGSWYRYTGMVGNLSLSQSFTGINRAAGIIDGPSTGKPDYVNNYHAFIGGPNGQVFRWAESLADGVPDDLTLPYTIASWDGGAEEMVFATGTLATPADYAGLWVTIRRPATNASISFPIRSATTTSVSVVTGYAGDPAWYPEAEDEVYIGVIPALVEFPWDQLEQPYYQKHLTNLVTWHDKEFRMRSARDYDLDTYTDWETLEDGDSQRKKTRINRDLEAVKIELETYESEAKLDSYGYDVQHKRSANTSQNG